MVRHVHLQEDRHYEKRQEAGLGVDEAVHDPLLVRSVVAHALEDVFKVPSLVKRRFFGRFRVLTAGFAALGRSVARKRKTGVRCCVDVMAFDVVAGVVS